MIKFFVLLIILTTGCVTASRQIITNINFDSIKVNFATKEDILKIYGNPDSTYSLNTHEYWAYVKPKIQFEFNKNGILKYKALVFEENAPEKNINYLFEKYNKNNFVYKKETEDNGHYFHIDELYVDQANGIKITLEQSSNKVVKSISFADPESRELANEVNVKNKRFVSTDSGLVTLIREE